MTAITFRGGSSGAVLVTGLFGAFRMGFGVQENRVDGEQRVGSEQVGYKQLASEVVSGFSDL